MPSAKLPTPEESLEYRHGVAEIRRSLKYSTYFIGNSQKSRVPLVDSSIAQRFGSEEGGSLSAACFLVIILSLVDRYRNGASLHTALLVGGATASILASLFLTIHCVKALQANKRPVGVGTQVAMTLLGFIPFVFALYLIGFQGLYMIVGRFSFGQLAQSVFFLLCGHWIARRIRRLQEFQSCLYEQLGRGN